MMHSKNTENIYGYTGKKSPNFNFVGNQSLRKDNKNVKNIVIKKNEDMNENIIKKICLKSNIDNLKIQGIDLNKEIINITDYLNQPFKVIDDTIEFEIILLNHEKGYSIKCNHYDYKFNIILDREYEEIVMNKETELNVFTTKITFKNVLFPFTYQFEDNPLCDAIFNDYIKSQLSEIKSGNVYILPVKMTNNQITYRQYISYMKTNSFLNFKINEKGWYVDSFVNDNDKTLVNGVDVKYTNYWIYHPRCTRIEHNFMFL